MARPSMAAWAATAALAILAAGAGSGEEPPRATEAAPPATAPAAPAEDPPPAEPAEDIPEVSIVPVGGDGARYWTRWRGPSGQGIAPGSGYPAQWSPQENVLWKVSVPGTDYSSPVVWGDWIFLVTSYPQEQRRSLLGFRRSDGQRVWETFAPGAGESQSERKIHHAISSPVTDGERVYAFLGKHGVIAVTLDGNPVWHKDLGPFDHATSSPLLHDGKLIVVQVVETHEGSVVVALDVKDGRTIWEQERAERMASGTPVVISVDGREQLIVSGQQQIQAYDPETGRELWKARGNAEQTVPTPVVGDGLVYSVSGPSGPIFGVFPDGKGLVTDTHIAWKSKQWGSFITSALYWEGYLYVMNDMSCVLTCFEARTGRVVWQERLGEPRREGFAASPVVADGKLFFIGVAGETFVLEPGPVFKLIRKNDLGEPVRATPALAEGRWYFRTAGSLVAIGS